MLVANVRAHCVITPPMPTRVVVPKESLSFSAHRSSRMQYAQCTPKQHPFWSQATTAPVNRRDKVAVAPASLAGPTFTRSNSLTATAIATTPPHMRAYIASLRPPGSKPAPKDITPAEDKCIENQRKIALKVRYVAIAETRERAGASHAARIKSAATLQASLKQEKNDIVSLLAITYTNLVNRINVYPAMSPHGRDLLMRTKDRLVAMSAKYLKLKADPKATKLLENCWRKASDLNKFACNQLETLKHDRAVPGKLTSRLAAATKPMLNPAMNKTTPDSGINSPQRISPETVTPGAIPRNTKAFSETALESVPEESESEFESASESACAQVAEKALESRDDPRGARPKDGAQPVRTWTTPDTLAHLAARAANEASQTAMDWQLPAMPPPGQAYSNTPEPALQNEDNEPISLIRGLTVEMKSMIHTIHRLIG